MADQESEALAGHESPSKDREGLKRIWETRAETTLLCKVHRWYRPSPFLFPKVWDFQKLNRKKHVRQTHGVFWLAKLPVTRNPEKSPFPGLRVNTVTLNF